MIKYITWNFQTIPSLRMFREFRRRYRNAILFHSEAGPIAATAQIASRFLNERYTTQVPRPLWRIAKQHLPKQERKPGPGRNRKPNRAVMNGLWFILWTGCQWKAVDGTWFGVSSSVLHERFQTWQQQGIWEQIFRSLLRFYSRKRRIQWKWQSVDSRSCASPLGGSDTGDNPTDRAKKGSKIHILVDQHGAPLSVWISGANQHDKWSVDGLIIHVLVIQTIWGLLDHDLPHAGELSLLLGAEGMPGVEI